MPLDMVEPRILTITTEDKSSRKDEIVLQYNPDGEETLEKLTENHDKRDYVTIDVPGMDLAINVSASLTPQEKQMVIKEAILKFPNVWEVTTSKVSYPKGSIHEHPIPTNPKYIRNGTSKHSVSTPPSGVQRNKVSYIITLMSYTHQCERTPISRNLNHMSCQCPTFLGPRRDEVGSK